MTDEQLELLAKTMLEWSETSGDHHILAAAAIRELINLRRDIKALQHAGSDPVAWISEIQCLGAGIYGKRLYGALPIQSLQPGYYKHIPLYTTPQPAAKGEK